jgi:hypothetical protein
VSGATCRAADTATCHGAACQHSSGAPLQGPRRLLCMGHNHCNPPTCQPCTYAPMHQPLAAVCHTLTCVCSGAGSGEGADIPTPLVRTPLLSCSTPSAPQHRLHTHTTPAAPIQVMPSAHTQPLPSTTQQQVLHERCPWLAAASPCASQHMRPTGGVLAHRLRLARLCASSCSPPTYTNMTLLIYRPMVGVATGLLYVVHRGGPTDMVCLLTVNTVDVDRGQLPCQGLHTGQQQLPRRKSSEGIQTVPVA